MFSRILKITIQYTSVKFG